MKLGFYLNRIDEKKYAECRYGISHDSPLNLSELCMQNDEVSRIRAFVDAYDMPNTLVIGGCCGYGVAQIKDLKDTLGV